MAYRAAAPVTFRGGGGFVVPASEQADQVPDHVAELARRYCADDGDPAALQQGLDAVEVEPLT